MSIKKIKIKGLRGFSKETEINFALPDKKTPGSGLTVIVGPNNSGKSTIIEAFHLLESYIKIIPSEVRNSKTNREIFIEVEDIEGNKKTIITTEKTGAFVERRYNDEIQEYNQNNMNIFILSNKRNFTSTFATNNYQDRQNYKGNINATDYRSEQNINNNFGGRLLNIIHKNRKQFDECLGKVLNPLPKWEIEAKDNENAYLEFSFNEIKHSSKGAGDGYINIFNIVDALYDSTENNVILIDEPEVSLHPDLQRKLFKLLVEYSKDKQIIITTHSPYFVDWELFENKSKLMRLKKENDYIKLYEIKEDTKNDIRKLISDAHHPHILSLNANEIFFLNDNIILTEGQDDVLCYKKIFEQYKFNCNASFFGWGAGGAEKVQYVLSILQDLGYKKVFIILDNDKQDYEKELSERYPNYRTYVIKAKDVRNKERNKKINNVIKDIKEMEIDPVNENKIIALLESYFPDIEGFVISMKKYDINFKYDSDIKNLIENIKKYFCMKDTFKEDKSYGENNEKNNQNIEVYEEKIAYELLNKYIKESKTKEYISKKYDYLKFLIGDGNLLSIKDIGKNKYYAVFEKMEAISEKNKIILQQHYIIDVKKEKVKLLKQKIIENTLPKKYY